MPANRYSVPKKVWNKWTDDGRKVFNELYALMRDQSLFTHPKAAKQPREQWKTTRWNAAWMAADLASDRAKARDYKFA